MKTVEGDLIALAKQGAFDVIVHGCNCFCTMGAGIAKSIRTEFPEAYAVDLATEKGERAKLGTLSAAEVLIDGRQLVVVNAYTQYDYSRAGVQVDYNAVRSVFALIKKTYSSKRIGYPLIGAGLAGGDWSVIASIVKKELKGEDHTVVIFK